MACLPKLHMAFRVPISLSFAQPVSLYYEEYVQKLYMIYHCYQVILQVKHFYPIGSSAKCWLQIYYWVLAWFWVGEYMTLEKHFKIPTINPWPKCPNENQMCIHFALPQLQCFCNDNRTVSTGSFCSQCLCCFVSKQLKPPDKNPQKAIQNAFT